MMRFGLQKLTLLDYPGVTACTVFTCGCNFRCPFCHNASLVTGKQGDLPYDANDLLQFLADRKKILDGVCITGGEPLLHPELPDVIAAVKQLGYLVKLDTNGSNPEVLGDLLGRGMVDYVAMDIKHCREKYSIGSGSDTALANVEKSVELLKNAAVDFEFRTTVVSPLHTAEDIGALARWISGCKRYYLQNYVDSGDILCANGNFSPVGDEELEKMLAAAQVYIPGALIRGK